MPSLVIALLFSTCICLPQVGAETFLQHSHNGRAVVNLAARSEELQVVLGAVLGCSSGKETSIQSVRKQAAHQDLEPVWKTLPKNQHGRVEWRLLRYMVHRHFMQRFGVLVRGLEPNIKVNSSHAGEAEIIQQAPALAQQLSGAQSGEGFSLEDAVAMVAALEQLLFESDSALLERVYHSKKFVTTQFLTREQLQKVLKDYMVYWMLGDDNDDDATSLLNDPILLRQAVPHWDLITTMAEGSVLALEFARQQAPVPGYSRLAFLGRFTFDDALEVVGSIGRSFASFWESQCHDTKDALLALDKQGTGRVRLPDFYGANKEGEWRFGESEAYLRELGALDETSSWQGKQVIVSNYMQAASNCVVTRTHYLVCCRVECEDILGHVEVAVGAPVAEEEEILRVVGTITDGDDRPARLDQGMRRQLSRMAQMHGGKVPLHGRLFAQWLHYAFPHECAFPHKTGAVASLTPSQFGEESIVNMEEVNKHLAEDVIKRDLAPTDVNVSFEEQMMTQWSEEEELLGDYSKQLSRSWDGGRILVVGGAATALLGLLWVSADKLGQPTAPTTHLV